MESNLRYLDAGKVESPVGKLQDAALFSATDVGLGKLDGIVVDPAERRVCYLVVKAHRRRRFLVPLGAARLRSSPKSLQIDLDSEDLFKCEEFRADRFPRFSDEDLITALFSPRAAEVPAIAPN